MGTGAEDGCDDNPTEDTLLNLIMWFNSFTEHEEFNRFCDSDEELTFNFLNVQLLCLDYMIQSEYYRQLLFRFLKSNLYTGATCSPESAVI